MRKRLWRAHPLDVPTIAELSVEAGISPLLAHLLIARGVRTPDAALSYLHPSYAHIHDPMRLPNMPAAVERLRRALDKGEKIIIYGDYDVDGTTSTALLIGVLRGLGANVDFYIPERATEGYGLNADAMHTIKELGADVLLTVDCGITAKEPLAVASKLGLDVIVTDHHAIDHERLPDSNTVVALIDTKLPNHDYPFDDLAGVGLAFKLCHALIGGSLEGGDPLLLKQLDLVALGTIADMAELRDENRALSKFGMEVMNRRERPGIKALCEVAAVPEGTRLTSSHIGFTLGPRINAAGRLDCARKVVELLTTDSPIDAFEIAEQLNAENSQRRQIERAITDEAMEMIESSRRMKDERAILVAKEGWHPGVVGIVASRLVERYSRPAVVIGLEDGKGRGSGRSIPEFHLQQGLMECRQWMVTFGGHAAAAGMTVEEGNIANLRDDFLKIARERLTDRDLIPKLHLDAILPLDELTLKAVDELELLEPYGQGNQPPRIGARGLKVSGEPRLMGSERQHLSVELTDGAHSLRAVHWSGAEYAIPLKTPAADIDVAGSVGINEFNGRRSVQLVAKDWQIHVEGSLVEHGIFPRREHPTWVKIVDNRERQDKAKYLDRVLRRNEPTLLLVRDDHAIQQARDLLTELGVSDQVGECPFDMSDADRLDRVTRFLNGDWNGLLAVAPLPDLAESAAWGTLRHVIFCHPPESDEAYLKLSSPALTGWGDDKPTTDEDVRYVHLLFNERDLEVDTAKRLALHPDDRTLRRIYKSLRGSATGFTDEQWRDTLDAADKRALDQARTVFEELGLIERNKDDRRVYQTVAAGQRELEDSPAFRRDRITRRAWELHAELYRKRTPRDFWEMLMRHRLNGEPRDDE